MGAQHLLLLGAYGQHNIGDDALLEVFVAQLGGEPLLVNSATPAETAARYGVDVLPTYNLWASPGRARGVLDARALVFGGGSLLKEIEGSVAARLRYMLRIIGLLELGRRTGKPTAMLGVGMGPLHTPIFRRLARIAAERTSLVCVRDRASAELLRSIGVRRPATLTADPVFLLEPPPRPLRAGPSRVVVIPRYSLGPAESAALAAACDHLVARTGARLTIVPFQTGYRACYDDLPAAHELLGRMRWRDSAEVVVPRSAQAALALLGGAELVLSARLHGLVFAAICGVAALGIDYEPKVRGVMAEAGQAEACLTLPELAAGRLPAMIDEFWPRRESMGHALAAYALAARSAAMRNFELFEALRPLALAA